MKFFICLQLIAYEYIDCAAGTSFIKESYSFFPRGRNAGIVGGVSDNTWNSKNNLNKSLLQIVVFRRQLDRLINRKFSMSLLAQHFTLTRIWKACRVGTGRVLNKIYREAPYRGPFVCHFSRKRYPFHIPSIDKLYPFHIPCLELCIHFNCCKWAVFQIWINRKNRTFCRLYKP